MPSGNQQLDCERNRLLRRVDWRFLLPDPAPTRVVCLSGGELASAIELVSSPSSEADVTADGQCDLVAIVDPDIATLQRTWRALRPGGFCYSEWSRAGGLRDVRQRLRKAGLEVVTCFSPWPEPAVRDPMAWIPLDALGPLRYLVTRMTSGRTWDERAAGALHRTSWILRTRRGMGSPICALARKPTGQTVSTSRQEPAPPLEILEHIRLRWEHWGLGPRPAQLSSILLTSGRRSINKVVSLIFAGSDSPRVVLKMPRVPEAAAGLSHEARVLRELQTEGLGVEGTPKLLLDESRGGHLTVITTALPGVPLSSRLTRSTYPDLAMLGTDWLGRFAGQGHAVPSGNWYGRLVDPILRGFETMFGSVVDAPLMREGKAVLRTLSPLPLVCEQRDFSPWNLLIDRRQRLQVLDWESAELNGLPLVDLIYFTTYLGFYVTRSSTTESQWECYREMLQPGTFTGTVSSECQKRYAERLGIAASDILPLRLLCWMIHSRSEYQRMVVDSGGTPPPQLLRRSLFLGLWETELHSALRPGPGGAAGIKRQTPLGVEKGAVPDGLVT